MDLFTRLGLQMLVITPLQKIWTIEPYVSAVGFAHAVGRRSEMITMTVEEYRARRAAHAYGAGRRRRWQRHRRQLRLRCAP
jgi:uncharacterized protein YPO0396